MRKYFQDPKNQVRIKDLYYKNIEKHRLYDRNRQRSKLASVKEYKRKWYHRNKERLLPIYKTYRDSHPEMRLKANKKYYSKLGFPLKLSTRQIRYALQAWANAINKHDSKKCQICHHKAEVSHHIIFKANYPELALNINNGIALCNEHHNEVHGKNLINQKFYPLIA